MAHNLNELRRCGSGQSGAPTQDFVDTGRRPSDAGGIVLNDENISRFQDILMVQLQARGCSLRQIGRVLRIGHGLVDHRIRKIPPEARRHYERPDLF